MGIACCTKGEARTEAIVAVIAEGGLKAERVLTTEIKLVVLHGVSSPSEDGL
jgi:hypothetical protein